jgi:DNA repair protein RecN (Recombination protein N)
MLLRLSIRNYALIQELDMEFNKGLTIITGETGAGKSIVLGALHLLLGDRADPSALRDKEQKCILEAKFNIGNYGLEAFFEENDLDGGEICIVRRELSPQGKSRAFVNDTPVNLTQLRELGSQLVDIHSQHDTLQLADSGFVLQLLDASAGNKKLMSQFASKFSTWKRLEKELEGMLAEEAKLMQEEDFIRFQFNELDTLNLKEGEETRLEAEIKVLQHAVEIREQFAHVINALDDDQHGAVNSLSRSISSLQAVLSYSTKAAELMDRIQSTYIELKDILQTAEDNLDEIESDPARLVEMESRLDKLNHVLHKHRVVTVNELIELRDIFDSKLQKTGNLSSQTDALKLAVEKALLETIELGSNISARRKSIVPKLEKDTHGLLTQLGMPKAILQVEIEDKKSVDETGVDSVRLMFSANAGHAPQELSKVASGGEFSRLMLSLKKIIARSVAMPTIVFDEIDTGVSGAIADRMGEMFESMSADMQVLVITHLPQIAGKGHDHLKVVKTEEGKRTSSKLVRLTEEERISEIASMLSGKELTDAAVSHAKTLLGMASL